MWRLHIRIEWSNETTVGLPHAEGVSVLKIAISLGFWGVSSIKCNRPMASPMSSKGDWRGRRRLEEPAACGAPSSARAGGRERHMGPPLRAGCCGDVRGGGWTAGSLTALRTIQVHSSASSARAMLERTPSASRINSTASWRPPSEHVSESLSESSASMMREDLPLRGMILSACPRAPSSSSSEMCPKITCWPSSMSVTTHPSSACEVQHLEKLYTPMRATIEAGNSFHPIPRDGSMPI
mmetsp:Transcript_58129/g.184960  ORF Transcript_58129/g.184960 Transcript_58129/m.184960 type:complete len:239 (-) Transcript_58129:383-1099(-)